MVEPQQIRKITERRQAVIDEFASGVPEEVTRILDAFEGLLQEWLDDAGSLTTGELAALNTAGELAELVRVAGLEELAEKLRATFDVTQGLIAEQLEAGGITINARTLDEGAIEALVNHRTRQVIQRLAGDAVDAVQTAWIDSTFSGQPLPEAMRRAVGALKDTLPSVAETQVGTAISSVDRAITAGVGRDTNQDIVYLYIGPSVQAGYAGKNVRATCSVIVNKWATREQIAQLNNGQTADVFTDGGGWNCRHSWAPVLRAIAIAQGWTQITDEDIKAFNDAGQKKGKKGKGK